MCIKYKVKIFHCNLVTSAMYLVIFYSITFYWRELDCKLLQGYLKPTINKLPKKKNYILVSNNHNSGAQPKRWCALNIDLNCSKNMVYMGYYRKRVL